MGNAFCCCQDRPGKVPKRAGRIGSLAQSERQSAIQRMKSGSASPRVTVSTTDSASKAFAAAQAQQTSVVPQAKTEAKTKSPAKDVFSPKGASPEKSVTLKVIMQTSSSELKYYFRMHTSLTFMS